MKKIFLFTFMFIIGINLHAQYVKYISFKVYNACDLGYNCTYTVTCHYVNSSTTYTIPPKTQATFKFKMVPYQYYATFDASCPNFSQTNMNMYQQTVYPGNCYGTNPTQVTVWDPTINPLYNHYYIYSTVLVGERKIKEINFDEIEFKQLSDDGNISQENIAQNATFDTEQISDFKKSSKSEYNMNLKKIDVYPNPTTGIVNLEYETPVDIVVYNILGGIVSEVKQTNLIDLNNLKEGMYSLKIITEDDIIFKKILLKK